MSAAIPCIEVPNLELSLFDLPILLTLIWHRWPFAVGNLILGAAAGFVLWGIHDITSWTAIYLNTLLLIGFIILVKRSFRALGLSVVGIAYWLFVGTPVTFMLFSLQFADNSVAIIATGQRLFSGVLVITAAIALHFTVVLIQHRLPDLLFGGERRFTVRMREIAESAAIMAAAIPMLFLLWALIDRDIDADIDMLFAASDARFESLAQAASVNMVEQRDVLRELLSLSGEAGLEQRLSSMGFDDQLLSALNAGDAIGFALQTDAQGSTYLSQELRNTGLKAFDIAEILADTQQAEVFALTDDEEGLTGYVVSTESPLLMLVYATPLALWDALYGADMLGLMSGLEDTGMIDRVSHFHGPSGQELYGISDDAIIVREEYDYAIWIPPARQVSNKKPFKRVERLSKSYITFQASDQLIESFDRDLYDVDCFRYTVDLWSHISATLNNLSFLILAATAVLFIMAALIEYAVGRFSTPFLQLVEAMESFSATRPDQQNEVFKFDLTSGTNLFKLLAQGFNRMETAVHDSTERVVILNSSYESLLNRARIGFIAMDQHGTVEYANPAANELIALAEDIPARIEAATANDDEVVALNIASQHQVVDLLTTQTPRINVNGEQDGKWLIASDVSALRSAERELLAAQRLSTLGQLTEGMAHEISQPLQAMTLTVGNMKRSLRETIKDQPTIGDRLTRLDDNIHRIANLIEFMKTYGGTGSAAAQAFSPADCIAEVIAQHDGDAHILNVINESSVDSELSVMGDPKQFALVIDHIFNNARDAALDNPSGTAKSITLTGGQIDGGLEVNLEDNCGGIAESALPKIFDPFFTTKDPDKGMGLGLSVSFGIVTSMGGDITASNTGEGARFTIRIPLA